MYICMYTYVQILRLGSFQLQGKGKSITLLFYLDQEKYWRKDNDKYKSYMWQRNNQYKALP